jgi:hypothetical protein
VPTRRFRKPCGVRRLGFAFPHLRFYARWTASAGKLNDGFRSGLRHFELASIESIKTRT